MILGFYAGFPLATVCDILWLDFFGHQCQKAVIFWCAKVAEAFCSPHGLTKDKAPWLQPISTMMSIDAIS